MIDDLLDAQPGELARITALRLDAVRFARPFRQQHLVALRREELFEVFPAARSEPGAVDENDLFGHYAPLVGAPSLRLGRRVAQRGPRATLRPWRRARSSATSAG